MNGFEESIHTVFGYYYRTPAGSAITASYVTLPKPGRLPGQASHCGLYLASQASSVILSQPTGLIPNGGGIHDPTMGKGHLAEGCIITG